jgi:hypothetical protein
MALHALLTLADPWDLLDKSDLFTDGSNYLAMAGTLANKLANGLQNTMNNFMPIGVIMKLIFWIMGLTLTFHILQAIIRAVQEGSPKGYIGEIFDTLWGHGPRIFIFATVSLMVAGVSSITNVGQNVQDVHVNNNYFMMQGVYGNSGTTLYDMQQAIRHSWGKEFDTVPAPMAPLKAGTASAIKAVSALSLINVVKKINAEIGDADQKGQEQIAQPLDQQTGIDETMLGWIMKDIIRPMADTAEELAFIGAQYSMMKNLVANYIYMVLAWRLALHFLPLMVCLAYFRSMQGFVMNSMKQLVALSIAANAMGKLASILYDGKFWLGNALPDGSGYTKTGVVSDVMKNIMIPPSSGNIFSPGSYPWVMTEMASYMAVIQIAALFGLVGVILGELYNIIRGAIDGAMRSNYSASISSTFGR